MPLLTKVVQENGVALKYATLAVRSDLPVVLANLLSNYYLILNLLSNYYLILILFSI